MELIDLLFGCAFGLAFALSAVNVNRAFKWFIAPMKHRARQAAPRT
jgi:hypothetical protein